MFSVLGDEERVKTFLSKTKSTAGDGKATRRKLQKQRKKQEKNDLLDLAFAGSGASKKKKKKKKKKKEQSSEKVASSEESSGRAVVAELAQDAGIGTNPAPVALQTPSFAQPARAPIAQPPGLTSPGHAKARDLTTTSADAPITAPSHLSDIKISETVDRTEEVVRLSGELAVERLKVAQMKEDVERERGLNVEFKTELGQVHMQLSREKQRRMLAEEELERVKRELQELKAHRSYGQSGRGASMSSHSMSLWSMKDPLDWRASSASLDASSNVPF